MSFALLTGRAPQLPLALPLADQSQLSIQRWLRVLPNRRYVGLAKWQGQAVVIKIFTGRKAAAAYQAEIAGFSALQAQAINCPEVLQHHQAGPELAWVISAYLDQTQSLAEAWQQVASEAYLTEAQECVLGRALVTIAEMHLKGLWQADLHLDNFLTNGRQLWVVDAGSIQQQELGEPISREAALANLAVFFAQLPNSLAPYLEQLLVHYILVNSSHALPIERLEAEIAKIKRWRLKDYLHKTARDCSLFSVQRSLCKLQAVWRQALPELQPVLANPDQLIAQGHIYKTGGAATVAKVEYSAGGRVTPLVIKRYNIKHLAHWLKRFWRPSRAWHSWQAANRLEFLGIPTPKALAVIEQRWLGLRGPAWFITEYCAGQDIIAHFAPYVQPAAGTEKMPPEAMLQALDQLFALLIRERISHGDLKGHNIFWQHNQWCLIDLDAMQQHQRLASFQRAYAKDRARFLRNWPAESTLYQLLDQRLPQAETLSEEH